MCHIWSQYDNFSYSTFGGICLSQVNHFLKLYWSPGYEERVTTEGSLKSIAGLKTGLGVAIWIGLMTDPNSSNCSNSKTPICNLLQPSKYVWVMIPIVMVILVTLSVTVYVVKIVLRLQNSVAPVVTLPLPTVSTQRLENKTTQKDKRKKDSQDVETKRRNSNPSMFFKVRGQRRNSSEVAPNVCFPTPIQLSLAWKVLKVNLLSLCILLLYLPLSIVFTYIYITGESCENIFIQSVLAGISHLVFNVLYLVLVYKTLDKFSN